MISKYKQLAARFQVMLDRCSDLDEKINSVDYDMTKCRQDKDYGYCFQNKGCCNCFLKQKADDLSTRLTMAEEDLKADLFDNTGLIIKAFNDHEDK